MDSRDLHSLDPLLEGIPAILKSRSLEDSLTEALSLLVRGTAARAAVLFLADGDAPLREIWVPNDPSTKSEHRPRLKVAALDAIRRGGPNLAACDQHDGDGVSVRTLLLASETAPLGAICLAWESEEVPEDVRTARWIAVTGEVMAHVAQHHGEVEKLRVQADKDQRWFKTLDQQIRVLDRERQKFAAVVNQTDTLVFVADDSRIVRWNNRAMGVLFPPDGNGGSWVGEPCSRVCGRLGLESREDCGECPVRLALDRNESVHQEMRANIQSASAILYLTALPITGLDGRPKEVMVLIQDLTSLETLRRELADINVRQVAERALRESEARKAAMVEAAQDAIVSMDHAGRIIEFNPAAERIFGHRREDVLGKDMAELIIPPALRELHRRGLTHYLATGEAPVIGRRIEMSAMRADGSEFPIELTIARISSDGPPVFTAFLRDITDRRQAEEALRSAEQRLRTVVATAPIVLFAIDRDGVFTLSEGKGLLRLGLTSKEVVGRSVYEMYRDHPKILANIERCLSGEEVTAVVDVGPYCFETWHSPIRDSVGAIVGLIGVATDITERRELEVELRHAQKMEAVGRLAGGVAHEFNNLLTVIKGHSEVMLGKLGPGVPLRKNADEIQKAGARGVLLTRQLLAFSRRDVLTPEVLDVGAVVEDLESMLRPLLGETIRLLTRVIPEALLVYADRGQIDQVLMNLAVNARDAMPRGGQITIEVGPMDLDSGDAGRTYDVPAGAYVMLVFRDEGQGMSSEVLSHLFEPFFTTKEQGKGTGLGMSVVYGIIRQAGGDIHVESEPDRGTTVRMVLPRHAGARSLIGAVKAGDAVSDHSPPNESNRARGTILLTEDERAVRQLAREMLEISGFEVLEAACAEEALTIAGSYKGPILVAVTDVVMPGMNGVELGERLLRVRPGIKVLYVSGYTNDMLADDPSSTEGVAFLAKPYTLEALNEKIRCLIHGHSRA